MKDDDEEPLRVAYRNLTIALLDHAFKGKPSISMLFNDLPSVKQEEIEAEIRKRADLVAVAMCRRLAKRGFIDETPPNGTITRLYRETLREFESL